MALTSRRCSEMRGGCHCISTDNHTELSFKARNLSLAAWALGLVKLEKSLDMSTSYSWSGGRLSSCRTARCANERHDDRWWNPPPVCRSASFLSCFAVCSWLLGLSMTVLFNSSSLIRSIVHLADIQRKQTHLLDRSGHGSTSPGFQRNSTPAVRQDGTTGLGIRN